MVIVDIKLKPSGSIFNEPSSLAAMLVTPPTGCYMYKSCSFGRNPEKVSIFYEKKTTSTGKPWFGMPYPKHSMFFLVY